MISARVLALSYALSSSPGIIKKCEAKKGTEARGERSARKRVLLPRALNGAFFPFLLSFLVSLPFPPPPFFFYRLFFPRFYFTSFVTGYRLFPVRICYERHKRAR